MNNQHFESTPSLCFQRVDSEILPIDKESTIQFYHPPQLIVVGKANNLVQSFSSGKYSDGYSSYYWER